MRPKEVLRGVGYLVGADVFIATVKKDDENIDKIVNAPLRRKPALLVKGSADLAFGVYKNLAVIPYRLSGLDLATKGVRKVLDRNRK